MQAQQVGQGYAARDARTTGKMLAIGLGLLVALGLAIAMGLLFKGSAIQPAAPAQSVTVVHQQAPDAADRAAAQIANDVNSQRLAAQAGGVPHQQSPDAQDRNSAAPQAAPNDTGLIP